MSIQKNLTNITITAEGNAAATAAVESVATALPFLISMTTADRNRLVKMGIASEGFVRKAYDIMREHGDAIPIGLSAEAMERDYALREMLSPLRSKLQQILAMMDDTMTAAGADLMNSALIVYRALQSHGEQAGLKTHRDELAERFAKNGQRNGTASPGGTEGGVGTAGGAGAGE